MKKVIALLLAAVLIMPACKSRTETPSGTKGSDSSSSSADTPDTSESSNASEESSDSSKLTGDPKDILEKLVADTKEKIEADGGFYYMTMTTEITADTSVGFIGFSADNYNKYVTAAFSSKAAIGAQAHEIILIQCKDNDSAKEVKKLIKRGPDPDQTDGGYDSMKWICVSPEKSVVVESGSYVLIAASTAAIVDSTIDVFKSTAGGVGEVDMFFEHTGESGEGGGLIAG